MHCKCKKACFFTKIFCHAAAVELSQIVFFSENDFCKADIISVKTGCIIIEKKYVFSQKYFCHAEAAVLRLSAFFSENNFCKADVISVITESIVIVKKTCVFTEIFLSCDMQK